MSAILFSSPGTRPTEAWRCCRLSTKDSSHSIGPAEESVLTLPLLAHPCASVLLTYVWMCAKGAILGANIRICMSSATISRSFIVISPVGLEEDTRRAWVAREKGSFQTNYLPSGYRHTPPIPESNALIVPIHVEGGMVVTCGGGWVVWPGCELVHVRLPAHSARLL